jgi:hypothetical protein
MDDEAWAYGKAWRGVIWHIVPYAPPIEGRRVARCGFRPMRGFTALRSSLHAYETLCGTCNERTGPPPVNQQP